MRTARKSCGSPGAAHNIRRPAHTIAVEGGGGMQRYMPGRLPQNNGEWPGGPAQQRLSPLQAAVALGEHVRTEHGRAGVQRLVAALSPLLPGDVLEQAARQLGVSPPARAAQEPSGQGGGAGMGGSGMEQMLTLMQALQKGRDGLDPKLLMQLMQARGMQHPAE